MSINSSLTVLADAVRSKSGISGKLSIDGMTAAVSNIEIGGGNIDFYECASYTPDADAYIKYTVTLSDAPDANANTIYERKKFVENPDPDSYIISARWQAENGYFIEENFSYGEWYYFIRNREGSIRYIVDMLSSRITDFRTVVWLDWDMNENVSLTFSAIQAENIPATTEGWTGYKVTQNPQTGAWKKSATLTTNMKVGYFKPKVGEIYSADTSIRVRKMFNGTDYPIPSNGLVFYAPLQTDYVDIVSGKAATVTGGTFSEHNGLSCLELDGSGYVKWPDNSDLPSGTSAASVVILVAPINLYDWHTYLSVGQEDEGHIDISAKNGHFKEWGGNRIEAIEWQSLIVTRDEYASGKAYLNGKLNGSGSLNSNPPMPSCVCVGSNMFEGYIYNAKSYVAFAAVYDRELSADEVLEIHNTLMDI